MGHTDRATVNQRRPLSPAMRELLCELADFPGQVHATCNDGRKNRLRALMDRGYALPPERPGGSWSITPAGLEMAGLSWGMKPRHLLWVDGVNSAVMAWLELLDNPDAIPAHIRVEGVHQDSHRFIDDLEAWYGKPILRLGSTEFASLDDVFERERYLSGPKGAPCTRALKFVPRLNFQVPSDVHYWGYTADKLDAKRFVRMQEKYPLLHQRAPLVELGLTKRDTHAILAQHGVRRPLVYDLGMPNGNCLCCVKSSSPNYWAHQRKHFPEVFARRAAQARKFGARLVRMGEERGPNGRRRNIRCFPDEVPLDWPTDIKAADFGGCGPHCTEGGA